MGGARPVQAPAPQQPRRTEPNEQRSDVPLSNRNVRQRPTQGAQGAGASAGPESHATFDDLPATMVRKIAAASQKPQQLILRETNKIGRSHATLEIGHIKSPDLGNLMKQLEVLKEAAIYKTHVNLRHTPAGVDTTPVMNTIARRYPSLQKLEMILNPQTYSRTPKFSSGLQELKLVNVARFDAGMLPANLQQFEISNPEVNITAVITRFDSLSDTVESIVLKGGTFKVRDVDFASPPNSLQVLEFEPTHRITDTAFTHMPAGLRILKIADSTDVTGSTLRLLPQLTELDISKGALIGNVALQGLSQSLVTLNASGCPGLTSLQGLPDSVLDLDISNCRNLLPNALSGLPPNLTHLDIGDCVSLAPDALNTLPASLQVLILNEHTSIPPAAVEILQAARPNLVIVTPAQAFGMEAAPSGPPGHY